MAQTDSAVVHGTAVAVGARGLLIIGKSGSGKSGTALQLMAYGATLVADDRVVLACSPQGISLTAPPTLCGAIEARGLGILQADPTAKANLCAVLDLDRSESARMPQRRETMLLGQSVPLFHKHASPYFIPSLLQYLKAGMMPEGGMP